MVCLRRHFVPNPVQVNYCTRRLAKRRRPQLIHTGYDGEGNLTVLDQKGQAGGNGVTEKQVEFGYNLDNQPLLIDRYQYAALPPGAGEGEGMCLVAASGFTYDDRGQLTALTHADQNQNTLAAYTWSYDGDGHVLEETSTADALAETGPATVNYVYDSDGQLTDATYGNFANSPGDEHYEFDANGNEKNNDQQVGTDNELQSDATFTYGYDAEGNCTSRTRIECDSCGRLQTLYTWDDRNRLTDVKFENNAGQVTSDVQYTYDVENRWIGETVTTYATPGDLSTGSVASQRQFVYDGNQIVLSFDGNTNSSLTNRYLWGPAVDQLLRDRVAVTLRERVR